MRYLAIVLAVVAAITTALFLHERANSAGTENHQVVVVLDSTKLAMLRLKAVRDGLTDERSVQDQAKGFTSELNKILAEYESVGILVLNKSVALATPKMVDVTPVVAQRMGIDMGDASDGK